MSTKTASKERSWKKAFSKEQIVSTLFAGYVPMLVALFAIAFPLLWMIASSFKPPAEIVTTSPTFLPEDPTWKNYEDVAHALPLGNLVFNSAVTTLVGTLVKIFMAITTAYAVVFIDFRFRNAVFMVVLVALMVPAEAAIIPNYMTIAALGGRNTLWGIILPGLGSAFGTFMLRQHFLSIPKELVEAAKIDGAGHWRILWRILFPVSIPSIATVGLIAVVTEWNAFLWPLIITDTPEHMTLPVGLNLLKAAESSTALYGTLMAAAALIILPILVIFAFLQKNIVAGLTQGAVKG